MVKAGASTQQPQDHKSTECSLTELLDWLKFEYATCLQSFSVIYSPWQCPESAAAEDKKSNLWSLPETLLLFFAFVLASAVHLGVFEAFRRGLQLTTRRIEEFCDLKSISRRRNIDQHSRESISK